MRFTKPNWVVHKDSSNKDEQSGTKHLSIFSVHVHPDNSRIATGGLDAKVRIWSTKPILSEAAEAKGRIPKSLCTLAMHTGPVLTVRWAHSGRWLASGSDDQVVMVWDLDPMARGKVWGSDEINVENWKPLKRLPGHGSDVTDLAWSPGDRYLASVGLDSMVLIWDGFSLECIRRLDQHQGFVKGVCWDPVGEFLATQSDDRSVKIWRTTDWELQAEVRKPFEDSPGSTFFRRLSWSPDGAHITASNATNNKGYVFIAAVIARNSWTSEISLVGHENTIEVACYNPHVFLRNTADKVATSNLCSVVALGADDRSVSVWQTKSARPLIVAKEVFERQIMDLSWSWDGLTLYAVSSDGTLAAFDFEPSELEGIAPWPDQEHYLKKFRFTPPPLAEGYVPSPHPCAVLDQQQRQKREASSSQPPQASGSSGSHPQRSPSVSLNHAERAPEVVNQLVAKRKPKDHRRRVHSSQALNLSHIPSASMAIPSASQTSASIVLPPPPPIVPNGAILSESDSFAYTGSSSTHPQYSPSGDPFRNTGDVFGSSSIAIDDHNHGSFASSSTYATITALDTDGSGKMKRRIGSGQGIELVDENVRLSKPRTLGGDRVRENIAVRQLAASAAPSSIFASAVAGAGSLPVPPLLNLVTYKHAGPAVNDISIEGYNPEGDGSSEVVFMASRQTQWLDYLPSPIILITATATFCAIAMQDGTVNVYSHTGRRLMPALALGSACSFLHSSDNSLLALTSAGLLHSWDVKSQSASYPPTSVLPLLSSPSTTLLSATIRPNGSPILHLSIGAAYSYSPNLLTFVKLSDRWWADGSDAWVGRERGRGNSTGPRGQGAVVAVEQSIAELARVASGTGEDDKYRPAWWGAAMTLGHLESRMHAARILDSPAEYKHALLVYAQRIAHEGFRGKGEELVKDLFGPVYWRPDMEEWSPTVLGYSKRDLLKEIVGIFVRSKTLTKLGMDWQDLLKKTS